VIFCHPLRRRALQRLRLVVGREGVDQDLDVAVEDAFKVIKRQPDPVVGHPPLREVVRPYPLAPVARTHLISRLRDSRVLLDRHPVEQPRLQDLHRLRFVLVLGTLILTDDDEARRDVGDPDGRVRGVHALTAMTPER